MMPMRLVYVQGNYVGAYHKNKVTRIRISIGDWHLWVECVEVGFYFIMSRM